MSLSKSTQNFIFGGGAAVVMLLLLGFVDWRVGVKVDAALAELDIGTDQKIVDMDADRLTNTHGIAENKEDITSTDQRLRDVANILMQPPGDDR